RWVKFPFRAATARTPRKSGLAAPRSRPAPVAIPPHVRGVLEIGDSVFVATNQGLWKSDSKQTAFVRVPAKNLPADVGSIFAASDGTLLAIADGALWSGDVHALEWTPLAMPDFRSPVLWLKEFTIEANTVWFAATPNGLYVKSE